jgi:tRNA A37 threonylcarbamoyladenosine synthetase subunit TsaC/SUA5/YrdC
MKKGDGVDARKLIEEMREEAGYLTNSIEMGGSSYLASAQNSRNRLRRQLMEADKLIEEGRLRVTPSNTAMMLAMRATLAHPVAEILDARLDVRRNHMFSITHGVASLEHVEGKPRVGRLPRRKRPAKKRTTKKK